MAKIEIKKVDEEQEAPVPTSARRARFEAIIEAYKKKNPVKYEQKKDELARQLAAIK